MEFRKNGKALEPETYGTTELWSVAVTPEDKVDLVYAPGRMLRLVARPETEIIDFASAVQAQYDRQFIGTGYYRNTEGSRRQTARPMYAIPKWMFAAVIILLLSMAAYLIQSSAAFSYSVKANPTTYTKSEGSPTTPPSGYLTLTRSDDIKTNEETIDDSTAASLDAAVLPASPTQIDPVYRFAEVPLDEDVQAYIQERAVTEDRTRLVTAMIWRESTFRSTVVSETNDYGLMQINGMNHEWLREELGINDFLDPIDNITAGTYMIFKYLDKHEGNYHLALMEYNMGLGNAKKLWADGIYSSKYSRAIVEKMNSLEMLT